MHRLEKLIYAVIMVVVSGFFILAATIAIVSILSSPAAAQSNCAPREVVVERLAGEYGEVRRSLGIGSDNTIVEVFASDDTGSWSITVTYTGGLSCLVASGQAFEQLEVQLPSPGDDT